MKFGVNYFGLLRAPMSWAKIGRETIKAFVSNGDDVCVVERKGFGFNAEFTLEQEITDNISNDFKHDITLSFEYPLNYKLIQSKIKAGMICYETTQVPKVWVENINKHLDILFLPDEFNKKIFVDCGVRKELIRIAPYGINTDYYYNESGLNDTKTQRLIKNEGQSKDKFRFLCVSMPQKRKGVDVLINAFEKTFGNSKDVELVLKFPYSPGKSRYDIEPVESGMGNGGKVKIITEEYTEAQMGDLYRSADCFVLPSRAEGFGMGYIEALACGVPVIATAWGAHMYFLNSENSLLVDYTIRKADEIQYDNFDKNAELAEPNIDDLCEKLKYMYNNYEKEKKKVEKFDFTPYLWGNIVKKMKEHIRL